MHRNIIHRSKNILNNATIQNNRIRHHQHLKNLGALTSTSCNSITDYNNTSLLVAHGKRSIYIEPHPMPAVAYDDYEYDNDTNINDNNLKNSSEQNFMTSTSTNTIYNVYAGGLTNNTNNSNGSLGVENDKLSNNLRLIGRSTKGGGGGSGGHRCPKCGAHVTFQSSTSSNSSSSNKNALQSNCFYCASCSGWFLIQPNLVDGTYRNESSSAHSKYLLSKLGKDGLRKNVSVSGEEEGGSSDDNDGILPTTPSKRKIGHKNQFVMRHVSHFICLRFVFWYCAHDVHVIWYEHR